MCWGSPGQARDVMSVLFFSLTNWSQGHQQCALPGAAPSPGTHMQARIWGRNPDSEGTATMEDGVARETWDAARVKVPGVNLGNRGLQRFEIFSKLKEKSVYAT